MLRIHPYLHHLSQYFPDVAYFSDDTVWFEYKPITEGCETIRNAALVQIKFAKACDVNENWVPIQPAKSFTVHPTVHIQVNVWNTRQARGAPKIDAKYLVYADDHTVTDDPSVWFICDNACKDYLPPNSLIYPNVVDLMEDIQIEFEESSVRYGDEIDDFPYWETLHELSEGRRISGSTNATWSRDSAFLFIGDGCCSRELTRVYYPRRKSDPDLDDDIDEGDPPIEVSDPIETCNYYRLSYSTVRRTKRVEKSFCGNSEFSQSQLPVTGSRPCYYDVCVPRQCIPSAGWTPSCYECGQCESILVGESRNTVQFGQVYKCIYPINPEFPDIPPCGTISTTPGTPECNPGGVPTYVSTEFYEFQ